MGSLRPVGDSPPRGDKGNREKNPERSFRGEETEPPVDFEEEILFLMILEAEADKLSALSFEQILWDRETGTVVVETRVTVAFQSARRQLYAARSVPKAALPQATEFSVLFIDSQAETLAELSIESTEE